MALEDDDMTTDSNTVRTLTIMTNDGCCVKHPHVKLRQMNANGAVFQRESCPECDEEFARNRLALQKRKEELDRQLRALEDTSTTSSVPNNSTATAATTNGHGVQDYNVIPPPINMSSRATMDNTDTEPSLGAPGFGGATGRQSNQFRQSTGPSSTPTPQHVPNPPAPPTSMASMGSSAISPNPQNSNMDPYGTNNSAIQPHSSMYQSSQPHPMYGMPTPAPGPGPYGVGPGVGPGGRPSHHPQMPHMGGYGHYGSAAPASNPMDSIMSTQMMRMLEMHETMLKQREQELLQARMKIDEQQLTIHKQELTIATLKEQMTQIELKMKHEAEVRELKAQADASAKAAEAIAKANADSAAAAAAAAAAAESSNNGKRMSTRTSKKKSVTARRSTHSRDDDDDDEEGYGAYDVDSQHVQGGSHYPSDSSGSDGDDDNNNNNDKKPRNSVVVEGLPGIAEKKVNTAPKSNAKRQQQTTKSVPTAAESTTKADEGDDSLWNSEIMDPSKDGKSQQKQKTQQKQQKNSSRNNDDDTSEEDPQNSSTTQSVDTHEESEPANGAPPPPTTIPVSITPPEIRNTNSDPVPPPIIINPQPEETEHVGDESIPVRTLDIDDTAPGMVPLDEGITFGTMMTSPLMPSAPDVVQQPVPSGQAAQASDRFEPNYVDPNNNDNDETELPGDNGDDNRSLGNTVSSSTYGDDRLKVVNQPLLDPYGDKGNFTGVVLRATGMPHGLGRMAYEEDGRIYEGDWRHGRWHGYGRASFSNGDSYEGEYKFDQRHGRGIYHWHDGRIYDGMFFEDKRHGKGKFTWPDGAVYDGEFVNGQREGHGSYTFSDGGQYNGSWKDGRYDGYGTCTWEDGRRYQGEWKNGMAHGYGTETYPNGSIRHEGQWIEDEPVR